MVGIVAVDNQWGIGYKGELLVSLPEDQRDVFRKYTLDKTIIYGRKTFFTFPQHKILPKRQNLILSRDGSFSPEGAEIFHDIPTLLEYCKHIDPDNLYVIGGSEVYKQFLPHLHRIIVTKILHTFIADAFFPNLDDMDTFFLTSTFPIQTSQKGYDFQVQIYERIQS